MSENAYSLANDDGSLCDMGGNQDALVEELYRVEGKAEIVNDRLVRMSAAGRPSRVRRRRRFLEPVRIRTPDEARRCPPRQRRVHRQTAASPILQSRRGLLDRRSPDTQVP
jgi:hypothetical protein